MAINEIKTQRLQTETPNPVASLSDPSLYDSLLSAFKLWENKMRLGLETCIPAIVASYDRRTHTAVVNPLLRHRAADGQVFDRAPQTVSVWRWQTGGFLVDVPLFVGDTGWLVASDRGTADVKNWNSAIQGARTGFGPEAKKDAKGNANGGNVDPEEGIDSHRYYDGFFIPDKWGAIAIPSDSSDDLVMEQISPDGKSSGRFRLSPSGVLTFERDQDSTKVIIDPEDFKGKVARFRLQKRVVGVSSLTDSQGQHEAMLTVRQSSVLATEDEELQDIDLASNVVTRIVTKSKDGQTKEAKGKVLFEIVEGESGSTPAVSVVNTATGDKVVFTIPPGGATGDFVTIATKQTITGEKTFENTQVILSSPTGAADDYTAIVFKNTDGTVSPASIIRGTNYSNFTGLTIKDILNILLDAPVDGPILSQHPSGNVPKAIATVGWVGNVAMKRPQQDFNFVANVRYDPDTQQIQKQVGTFIAATGVVNINPNWVMIDGGQAVEHTPDA